MTLCTATFETGVNGASVLAADPGSATAWDAVTVGGGTLTYSNAHAADGTLSALHSATGSQQMMVWSTALGTITDHYGRFYTYWATLPGSPVQQLIQMQSGAGVNSWQIQIDTAGKLKIYDALDGLANTFTNAIATGQWVRVEYHIVHSTTVGLIEVKLFNTATSSTATETYTSSANKNTRANADRVFYGPTVGGLSATAFHMDAIVAGATSYPGPIPVIPANTVAPAVTGTTALGDTLTTTDGTWTGTPTPTFTYQWQRDGVNIGGATATTRVIAGADQGTTLRCVVTGTNTAGAVSANSNGVSVPAAVAAAGSGMNPGLLGYLYNRGRR